MKVADIKHSISNLMRMETTIAMYPRKQVHPPHPTKIKMVGQ